MNRFFKNILMFVILLNISVCLNILYASTDNLELHNHTDVYYTCSMHPQIREKKPGKCPICHMNLTKIEIDGEMLNASDVQHSDKKHLSQNAEKVVANVKLRKAQLKHFKPDFFPVSEMKMTKKIRLLGLVLQSEQTESKIPARVKGRVEKVYVKSTGSFVRINDPVIDLYSPELITAGEEYLIARKSYELDKDNLFKEMLDESEKKLSLWGIKKFQYDNWYKNGKVPRTITIHANTNGVVITKNAIVGKYFKEGENFFELWDLKDVWVEMDVYESDASLVKIGQKIDLMFSALPGEILVSYIDFINPFLDIKSKTLKVRATIKNDLGKLRPGMVANAVLNIEMDGKSLVVPRTAIIDTGKRKVVWVKVNNRTFQAKAVLTGYESEGYIEIKNGLIKNEEVVIEGNFLLDAQAQLFGGYEDMKTTTEMIHNH
ncbi:efflux RND transporter periplasmic adaptor subunit [Sulfurovum sp. AR]|uniref:efflux RND transporter periplasmic adaptor subunit n=1 Tax=Sulfurovum sp. AR TaxID=1165841 RepID=UPI00025C4CB2|nr:efflux RND transporter periplasmic adaptor subunit [Sulfurovum sp. AR]EIF51354.1 putative metal transport-related, exported protein [Sulfurovum sp. AR]